MSENSQVFVCLYTKIASQLRKMLKVSDPYIDYSKLLTIAKDKHIISNNQLEVLSLVGRLRNAIIHDLKFLYPYDSIAEPHNELIKMMELIQDSLLKPLLVQNLKASTPYVFHQNDNLFDCIKLMREKDYSQVVVQYDDSYGLFTREDEAKWLEHQADEDIIMISLKDFKIKDVQSVNVKDQCVFISKSTTAIELVDIFRQNSRSNVAAVLVSENGKQSEKPIKIFTHWDLPDIIEKIELF